MAKKKTPLAVIRELKSDGWTQHEIAAYLNDKGYKTTRGKNWNSHSVGHTYNKNQGQNTARSKSSGDSDFFDDIIDVCEMKNLRRPQKKKLLKLIWKEQ